MKLLKEILSWTFHIVIAFAIALLISIYIIQPTSVEGRSMEPTLANHDRVLISKLPQAFAYNPEYGDIVVIDSRVERPRTFKDEVADTIRYNLLTSMLMGKSDEEVYWIKRVIGKPGDIIELKDGKVYRNGSVVDEPYIKEKMITLPGVQKVTVPGDSIFVMGDNRNKSKDSREIGSVPIDHVIGKYAYKLW